MQDINEAFQGITKYNIYETDKKKIYIEKCL